MTKVIYNRTPKPTKGYKLLDLDVEDLINLKLLTKTTTPIDPTKEQLDSLYKDVRDYMEKNNYVFGPYIGYRATLNNKARLIKFSVEFKHIE